MVQPTKDRMRPNWNEHHQEVEMNSPIRHVHARGSHARDGHWSLRMRRRRGCQSRMLDVTRFQRRRDVVHPLQDIVSICSAFGFRG
jgi:hypothetical protein